MLLRVNGKDTELPDGLTLSGLLDHFKLKPEAVVVEWNRTVPQKAVYAATALQAGDQIEIVKFMGGG